METFAKRLNEALDATGVSAAELSKRIGVAEGTISNYRKGKYEPKQIRLHEIAVALDVSVSFLMGFDVPMKEKKPPTTGDYSFLEDLTPEEKEQVLKYAAFVKSQRNS